MRNRPPSIWELPPDPLAGSSGAAAFYALAVGKRNTADYPYTVPNEKVCSEIGRVIGLRIPEVLLYRFAGEWWVFSHFINQTDSEESPPEGTAGQIAEYFEHNPSELNGMVCFDLFVCNNDRKTDNLVLGEDNRVWLIDHANALFYRPTGTTAAGIPRLASLEGNLAAMLDKPHRFLEALNSWSDVDMWCERISQIPSYFIRTVIDSLPAGTIRDDERDYLVDFLEKRKRLMRAIIEDNKSFFPMLDNGGRRK